MADLAELKAFNLVEADLTIWVYKRSTRAGETVFTGRWVGITEDLAEALREAVGGAFTAITETLDYSILEQNNEASALVLDAGLTQLDAIEAQAVNPTPARKVRNLKQIANSDFYVLRFASEAGVLHAVRKTNSTWSTRKAGNAMRVVFSDDELDIDTRPSFSLDPFFDFFALGGTLFVTSKPRFESVLSFKAAHEEAFAQLSAEDDFSGIFSDLGPILAHVGNNKIQLRRAIAIREKGHYRDADYMTRLRAHCEAMKLSIEFDEEGRIVPTPENCKDIFQALLNHRLDSRLSVDLFDVQSSKRVN